MATKLKKHNPFLAFMIYFLALNVFFGALFAVFLSIEETGLALDYKLSWEYRANTMRNLLRAGYTLATDAQIDMEHNYDAGTAAWESEAEAYRQTARETLDSQGGNIAYLIYGTAQPEPFTRGTKARTADDFLSEMRQELALSSQNFHPLSIQSSNTGYDHVLILNGGMLYEVMNTRTGYYETSAPLSMSRYGSWFNSEWLNAAGDWPDKAVICMAVRAEGAFVNNYGSIYENYYLWYTQMMALLVLAGAALVSLFVFLAVRLKKQSLAIARAKLAAFTGWFWLECKVLAAFLAFGVIVNLTCGSFGWMMVGLGCFWGFWLLVNDLRCNGKGVFTHNSINSLRCLLDRFDSRYLFCARMKRRILFLIVGEFCLVFLALLLLGVLAEVGLVIDLFLLALALFLLVRYINTYNRDIDVFAAIIDYTAKIRAGTATEPLELPPENAFAPLAADLNDIHSGMTHMVDEQVRSEKMKVELITNVSHDLKTPLTSIINYVDLLGKEPLTPDYANDYVKVLANKAERLKNLVQDLFEISKANSGAIDLNLEQLNIQSLVEQTVAELDQRTAQAGVEIKLQLCEAPLVVRADGKKLHRVFENLLGNALKYSLSGTRVYIAVTQEETDAEITFKNVAGYEMTFTAEEIVERFQRGDASRTTEGSGLGLAIAKSFLELNGGSLQIELDGDLFKAIVRIPLYVPYAQRAVTPPAAQPPRSGPEPRLRPETMSAPPSQEVQKAKKPLFFRKAAVGSLVSGSHAEGAGAVPCDETALDAGCAPVPGNDSGETRGAEGTPACQESSENCGPQKQE